MGKLKTVIIFAVLVVLILSVSVSFLFIPLKEPGKQIEFIINPGTSVRSIAAVLKEKKVIPNEKAFLIWIRLNKLEKSIQAGKVIFNENDGIIRASKKLLNAKAIEIDITIREGFTIEQTARKVAEIFPIDTNVFINLCYDKEFIKTLNVDVPSLEGFLFPNTYRFLPDAKSKEIITRFIRQYQEAYGMIEQTETSKKFTMLEIITLASIVEKEATLPEERRHISGVFHNRLRLRVPLGADPTVRFFLKKFSGPLRVSELRNPSPYNTRVHIGLPPGPICSPGKKSIEAAINPLKTKDLYFVAKWDGTGAHDFSETGVQHERKKLEIRRQNELRKKKLKRGEK
ncbi:MAG: endolytic transglycosylase MltG [Chitinispirillia bacterium]|jgi:UPF0755 protein